LINCKRLMKKTDLLTVCISATLLALGSCKKDNNNNKPSENVVYSNDFSSDDKNWPIGAQGDSLKAAVNGGYYQLTNKTSTANYFYGPPLFPGSTGSNRAIESSVKVTATTTTATGYGGLVWGFKTSDHSKFVFGIYTDGYFDVWGYPDGRNYKEYQQ